MFREFDFDKLMHHFKNNVDRVVELLGPHNMIEPSHDVEFNGGVALAVLEAAITIIAATADWKHKPLKLIQTIAYKKACEISDELAEAHRQQILDVIGEN